MNVRMNGICVNRYKQDRWLAYISPYLKLPLVICMNKNKTSNDGTSQLFRSSRTISFSLAIDLIKFFYLLHCMWATDWHPYRAKS